MYNTTKPIPLTEASASQAIASIHITSTVTNGKIQRNVSITSQRGVSDTQGNFVPAGPALTKSYNEAAIVKAATATDPESKSLTALLAQAEAHSAEAGL